MHITPLVDAQMGFRATGLAAAISTYSTFSFGCVVIQMLDLRTMDFRFPLEETHDGEDFGDAGAACSI